MKVYFIGLIGIKSDLIKSQGIGFIDRLTYIIKPLIHVVNWGKYKNYMITSAYSRGQPYYFSSINERVQQNGFGGGTILLSVLAQYRLNQHFDNKKKFWKVSVAVLFSNSKWEERQDNKLILRQDNKLISPQEVKLRCGIRDVNTLWGPESKSYKLFDINFLSRCIQAYG